MIHLNRHEISASIKDRYATVVYSFAFENTNQYNQSDELKFEITINPNAFIAKFEADIDGELFIGKTKEKETASNEYKAAKQKNENAILISQPHKNIPNVFEIKTNINSKSKILLTIQIEQYLQKQLNFNELNIQILRDFNFSIKQKFDFISFQFNIEDSSGIYDINIANKDMNHMNIDGQTMNKMNTKCEIKGKIVKKSSINELTLKYKVKGEAQESQILFDNNSNTFCHIISDIISNSITEQTDINEGKNNEILKDNILIPRRIYFVIDRSGSMSGTKWNKTISSTIVAIKQLRNGYDRFGIILFDNNIELLPYEDIRGCCLANQKSKTDSIDALQNKNAQGSTNINDALLKAIELIKIDILLLNNDEKSQYNFFMNQLILITDGEPNMGETDTNKIVNNVKTANDLSKIDKHFNKISIFSFGVGRDGNDSNWINDLNHSFLKILSVNNNGFYQRIKQQSADTILSSYFNILSKPVLSNINIQYKNKNITNLTQTKFNTLYFGSDLIVCGKINDINKDNMNDYNVLLTISAVTGQQIKENDKVISKPIHISKQIKINLNINNTITNDTNNTERVWAYLKLQQFAKQKLIHGDMIEMDDDEKKDDASVPLSLALKYKFVTPWTSMIVVKNKQPIQPKPIQPSENTTQSSCFGFDLNTDPELAMACRMSLEEDRYMCRNELGGNMSSLFRCRSTHKWDETELLSQKKEMQQQMVMLIQQHTSNINPPPKPTHVAQNNNECKQEADDLTLALISQMMAVELCCVCKKNQGFELPCGDNLCGACAKRYILSGIASMKWNKQALMCPGCNKQVIPDWILSNCGLGVAMQKKVEQMQKQFMMDSDPTTTSSPK